MVAIELGSGDVPAIVGGADTGDAVRVLRVDPDGTALVRLCDADWGKLTQIVREELLAIVKCPS